MRIGRLQINILLSTLCIALLFNNGIKENELEKEVEQDTELSEFYTSELDHNIIFIPPNCIKKPTILTLSIVYKDVTNYLYITTIKQLFILYQCLKLEFLYSL